MHTAPSKTPQCHLSLSLGHPWHTCPGWGSTLPWQPLELVHGGVIGRLAGSSLVAPPDLRGPAAVFDGTDHYLKESMHPG